MWLNWLAFNWFVFAHLGLLRKAGVEECMGRAKKVCYLISPASTLCLAYLVMNCVHQFYVAIQAAVVVGYSRTQNRSL